MPSTWSLCAVCLRTTRRSTASGTLGSTNTSAARAYSRATSAATLRPLYLDFLAPSAFTKSYKTQSSRNKFLSRPLQACTAQRMLATTSDPSAAKPAHPIQNPRNDDSGNLRTISISPRASKRLHAISTGDKNPNLALRVTVESGGCHGFQYLMDLTDLGETPATEEDTVFEGDKGEKVVIDESSLELLSGSTVDYTMELIGSQFKITGIPGATSSCGCGTSFDIQL